MRKAILAGIQLKDSKESFDSAMHECRCLCEACNIEVVETITQISRSLDPKTAFRSGKVEELAMLVESSEADLVVFYNNLSIQVMERISASCHGVDVIDRNAVILDIFSSRARSRQAKLQTELARLQYDLPRVLSESEEGSHERGGLARNRGGGEMRSEVISRKYQARMNDLKKELEKIEHQRSREEKKRTGNLLGRAALVGYTNAGKSSFMNQALNYSKSTGTKVEEKDMLFATLDTSVRSCAYDSRQFLLYDTVGFVSALPHTLVEAFKSTLASAKEADLLVHIIDASDPLWMEKAEITLETLKEIGAEEIPIITVYNKIDLLEEKNVEGMAISCRTGEGIEEIMRTIVNKLYPCEKILHCFVPYDKMAVLSRYRRLLEVKIIEHEQDGMLVETGGPTGIVDAFTYELNR